MSDTFAWKPVPLRLRVMEQEKGELFGDLIVLRWNAEDGSLGERLFAPGDWHVRPAWADGGTATAATTTRRVRRRLSVVSFTGVRFGTGDITLRWNAEDGSRAQRTFHGSVWHIMPGWAERDYHAAITAPRARRRTTRFFDVTRVSPGQSPSPPAPEAPATGLSMPSPGQSRRHQP